MLGKEMEQFLIKCFFKNTDNIILGAIDRAYIDMSTARRPVSAETNDFKKERDTLIKRLNAGERIYEWITKLYELSIDDFDKRHMSLCREIMKIYNGCFTDDALNAKREDRSRLQPFMTVGMAQKWVNMTVKYVYYLCAQTDLTDVDFPTDKEHARMFHVPLDSYILKKLDREYGLKDFGMYNRDYAWSGITSYDRYWWFQCELRKYLYPTPIEWEMNAWIDAADEEKTAEFAKMKKKYDLPDTYGSGRNRLN